MMREIASHCCEADPVEGTEIIDKWGWCGKCKEMAEFINQKQENQNDTE